MGTHYRTCNICEAMCGLVITHEDGEVTSIKPDPNDPLSRGHICPKAVALQDFRTDPDRVTKPLIKRNGAFEEVSWDEAYDFAVERLQAVQAAHGKDAVGIYLGNPNAHKFGNLMNIPGLVRALGTQNRYSSATADQIPHHVASIHMLGHPMLIPVADIDRTDYLMILGGNPIVSNGSMMTAPGFGKRMQELQARGGKVVVLDPRRTETAEKADAHHFIRPESDALFLLALVREVFERDAVRLGHLSALVTGVDALREAVQPFTPELAAGATGLSADMIREIATEYLAADRAVIYARMGASTQSFGGLCLWATYVLNILTGNFDREGGAMFSTPAVDYVGMTPRKGKSRSYPEKRSRVSGQPLYNGEFPVSVMAEEMETPGEGQIKALITIAGNPVISAPNGKRIANAMEKLDFVMSIDIHVNDATRHADLILPATVALEEVVYDMVFHSFAVRNTAAFARPLFDPPEGNPQEWEVIATLAARLSGANQIGPSPEQMLGGLLPRGYHPEITVNALLDAGTAVDLGPLVPCLKGRLETPDENLRIAPEVFLEDLPRLLAHAETEPPALVMIGRRLVRSHNSWTQNAARLVKGKHRVTAQIHPDDAAAHGITDGADVTVTSRSGAATFPAEVTDSIAPGVVSIPQGWGQRAKGMSVASALGTASINDITDDTRIDPVSGNAAFNGVPVSLSPA